MIDKPMKDSLIRLKGFFTNSLSTKILIVFLLVTVIPLLVSDLIIYENSVDILRDEYIKSNLKVIQQGSINIENYFDSLNKLSLSPYASREFMSNTSFDPSDFTGTQSNENFLKNILFSRDDIVYLYYYITKRHVLYSFSKQIYADHVYPQVEKESWFINTLKNSNALYFGPMDTFKNYKGIGATNADHVISINRVIKNISTGDNLGVISMCIDNRKLGQLCDSVAIDNEFVVLSNIEGDVYYSNNKIAVQAKELLQSEKIKAQKEGYYNLKIGNEDSIIIYTRNNNGLILMKAIPYRLLDANAKKPLKTSMIIILIVFFTVLALSAFFSRSITLPIKRLAKSMKKFGEGDFNIVISHKGNDEIGLLTDMFSEMTSKITSLIHPQYKSKIAKKNAQLRALQAQINPHFIYNALQSIGTLALRKEAHDIYALANAIANMLRYSLKSAKDMVPLYVEIDNMNNYLYVQKVRFGDRLNVNLTIDENAREFMVPRLILQPLVENSIKYGIDDMKPSEDITILAVLEDDFIIIEVKDTGRGMNKNELDMIREWLDEEDYSGNGEHLGIKNILNRIKLIYGEQALLSIESKAGEGSTITIRIPVHYEGEDHV